ncbi:uncharacterized protein PV06_00528 [Exophiala oligosperma]|uniref:Uncharacterized protein n=1 Tax=Exophiala oligosperma TaxID=215243 RepID=A0A0D2CDA0_9EURO|nr:uncharacterized protein PV06_00528 [Exophiala oligosperma]KIW47872.1 hypothetical protein PV06_00528 [Exophiala oligosperma]
MDSSAGKPHTWLELEGKLDLNIRADSRLMFGFLCCILCLPRIIFGWVIRLSNLLIWNVYLVLWCFTSKPQSSVTVFLGQGDITTDTTCKESQVAKYTTKCYPSRCRDRTFGTQHHVVKLDTWNNGCGICTPISPRDAIKRNNNGLCARPKIPDLFRWGRYRLNKEADRTSLSIAGPKSRKGDHADLDREADTTVRLKRSRNSSKRGSDGTLRSSASLPHRPGLCNPREAPCDKNRVTSPQGAPRLSYATPPPLASINQAARGANFVAAIPCSRRAQLNTNDGRPEASLEPRRGALNSFVSVLPGRPEAPSTVAKPGPGHAGKESELEITIDKAPDTGSLTSPPTHGSRQLAGGEPSNGKGKGRARSTSTGARGAKSARSTADGRTWEQSTADDEGEEDDDDDDDDQSEPAHPTDQEGFDYRKPGKKFRCPLHAANPSLCENLKSKCWKWDAPKIDRVSRHVRAHIKDDKDKMEKIDEWSKRKLKPEERWREYYRLFGGLDSNVSPYSAETGLQTPITSALAQMASHISQNSLTPSESRETLQSFVRLFAEKEHRDVEARAHFHSQQARLHSEQARIHHECEKQVRNSGERFEDAVRKLSNRSTTTPTRLEAGNHSPDTTVMPDGTQDEDLLHIMGNSGRQPSGHQRPMYATHIWPESGPASSSRSQDPTHLMVPTSSQSSQYYAYRNRIPPQEGQGILGTGIAQREETINQVLSTTDRLLDPQQRPPKRRRYQEHQRDHQQTSWNPDACSQLYQGLADTNYQGFSLPDDCRCTGLSPSKCQALRFSTL